MTLFSMLPALCQGRILQQNAESENIDLLVVDSRKTIRSIHSLFFAIREPQHDGHDCIPELYRRGIMQFVVEKNIDCQPYPKANIIRVQSSVKALQTLAGHHRKKFSIPIVAIAGNKGKTTVREWLYQLLCRDLACIKTPGNDNSQTGVPRSLWLINEKHQLGIVEVATGPQTDTIKALQKIISPTIGIITHTDTRTYKKSTSAFKDLFIGADTVIYCHDSMPDYHRMAALASSRCTFLGWGQKKDACVRIRWLGETAVRFSGHCGNFAITLPFADTRSKKNMIPCILALRVLHYAPEKIQEKIHRIRYPSMHLEMTRGARHTWLVTDTYSHDLSGLHVGMDCLAYLGTKRKTAILSDILPSGETDETVFQRIAESVKRYRIDILIGIGKRFHAYQYQFHNTPANCRFYPNTAAFMQQADWGQFHDTAILVKGSEDFTFDTITLGLQKKTSTAVMKIDLDAVSHNFHVFRSLLNPRVKTMAMVKAFAYGNGSVQIAKLLQYHRVDYLGVAHIDEGAALRRDGIDIPIMVMNPTSERFDLLLRHRLEPVIHTLHLLCHLIDHTRGQPCSIHIKLDTGMQRIGLQEQDIPMLNAMLAKAPHLNVISVLSHLAGADEHRHDDFSTHQAERFRAIADRIASPSRPPPLRHILNSAGSLRLPQFQWDMVRLGIGLYGVDPTEAPGNALRTVATLTTVVLQVKKISRGSTVGYGRRGTAREDMTLATLGIGYADGFSRHYSRGRGEALIRGQKAPVVGTVCMDMIMVDATAIEGIAEGDQATLFGPDMPISEVAAKINTIPYETLTGIGIRVQRIFYTKAL